MDGPGPIMSLQSAGANMYSPKRRSDYAGDFLSLFPSDDFWQTPKQEPVETSNTGLDYIPPKFRSAENNIPYGYINNEMRNMQNSSAVQPASNGLSLSYSPMEGYGRSMNDVLSADQAFPPPVVTNETLDSVDFDYNTEQQLQHVAITDELGFQNAQENTVGDFALAYGVSGVDYTSMQAISSPPAIYVRPEYNDGCEIDSTTVSYTTSMQIPQSACQPSTVSWNQNIGDDMSHRALANSNIDSVSPVSGQPFSMQPSTPWNLATGGLLAHNPASYDNTIPSAGSPFENSPLSSLNVTPLVPQLIWDEGYSTNYVDAEDELAVQNEFVHQTSPAQDITTSATTATQLLTDGITGQSKVQYQTLVSVIQVEVKKEPESESPPEDYQPRMDELVGNFDSNPTAALRKRKRSKFTTEDAEKVREVRKNGACVACRQRKVPCSVDEVCKHCLKAAKGSLSLAGEICVRDKLQDSYVGVKTIFGSLDSRRGALEPLLRSLSGDVLDTTLFVLSFTGGKAQPFLPLKIQQCNVDPICRWKGLSKVKGINLTKDSIYDKRYAVVPGSVSSAAVENFAQQILPLSGTHSGKITHLLDDFLSIYSSGKQQTALRSFVNATFRVVALNGLVQYGTINIRDGTYDLLGLPPTELSYVSPTIHDQIRLIAASGLKDAEEEVFKQIDAFKKLVGPNKHARIVGGICLMRLILLYRDRAIRDAIRLSLPRQKLLHRARLEQSVYMYKRLTIAYGILCRDANTPLTTTWVAEGDKQKGTGANRELQDLFEQLHIAYDDFCRNHLTEEHDAIFKGLVVPAK